MRTLLVVAISSLFCLSSAAADEPPQITLVVGNWLADEGSTKTAEASPLKSPFGVDFDADGHMYIVELYGGRIHRLSADGKFNTLAGDKPKGYTGDGGPASEAQFDGIHNVATMPDGTLYIADSWNNCIRKIDGKSGKISTFAGTGEPGYAGDGGPAAKAQFNEVICITHNPTRDKLYLADIRNRRIRVIDMKTTNVQTVAGNGKKGVPKDGALANEQPLVDPRAVAADSQGNIYVLERGGNALRVVKPDGKIYTVAGTGKKGRRDGEALQAELNGPKHLCVDDKDNVFIADDQNNLIRKYDPQAKTLTTVLGSGQGRPAVKLSKPHGVCFEKGKLYVADSGHDRILRIE